MAKLPDVLQFTTVPINDASPAPISIVRSNILSVFYDTDHLGVSYIEIPLGNGYTQIGVVADAATVVAKVGVDSMLQVSQFGQPANILYWMKISDISSVFLAVDDPLQTPPGPVGATRIFARGNKIDVSDTPATIIAALGRTVSITYP